MNKKLETFVNQMSLKETIKADIFRGTGGPYSADPDESLPVEDLIVTAGRVYIAKRIAAGDTVVSAMAHIAVGTGTVGAALGDTNLPGEVKRKATAIASTLAGDNVFTAVATFGGFADSVTSLALTEAGLFNHASSGQATMMQRVTFASVVLANSDIFRLTLETNVGSS